MAYHLARDTGIAADNNLTTEGTAYHIFAQCSECRNRLGYIDRIERIACFTANSTTET